MLQYLINITDNTLPVIIVMAVFAALVAAASPKGRKGLCPAAVCGVIAGALAALVYAVLKRNTGIAVREYYDLGVLLFSLPLSLIMLVLMWRYRLPGPAREPALTALPNLLALPALPARALTALIMAAWAANILPNILLYPFEFAVGMESIYNTDFIFRVIGYCAGLMLMFLLAVGLYKVSASLPRRYVLVFFAVLLLVLFARQALELVQILVGRNLIPRYRGLMPILMFFLTHVDWFSFALMAAALAAAATLIGLVRFSPISGGNPAIRRRQKAAWRAQVRYAGLVIACLVICSLTISCIRAYSIQDVEISPPLELSVQDGKIIMPLEHINDGGLHRFVHKAPDGTGIRYIVIKKSQTSYGVGLDACDICGPSGYYQRKGQVICRLCDVVMNTSTIGFPGGCNPVPLRFSVSSGNMVILAKDLDAEQQRFK